MQAAGSAAASWRMPPGEEVAMGELKSTLDLVMEKYGGAEEAPSLTAAQKAEIAEIRKVYQAKIAEAKILLAGDENLPREISRLESEMEEKIQRVRNQKAL